MTTTPAPGPGPWEQSCQEQQADLDAVARAAAMTPEQRHQAAAVLSSLDRANAYREGRGRLAPTVLDDAWSPPRWQQADAVTGGPDPRPPVVRLPSGSLLDHIAPGNVLDPPLPKRKPERKPVSRCSRCGCWSTPTNVVLVKGVFWCRTCCGGHQEPGTDSGASP